MKFGLKSYLFRILVLMVLAIGCGSSSSITAVVNGQTVSFPIDSVIIVAGGIDGGINSGSGIPTDGRGVAININFRSSSGVVDLFQFVVVDVFSVPIGETIYIDNGNIGGTYFFNGLLQPSAPGLSVIQFSELGNAEGQHVEGDFQVGLPTGNFSGHFSGSVVLGY